MDALSRTHFSPQTRQPGANGIFPPVLRLSGQVLSLASDIAALEDCLALERASTGPASIIESTGIFSPPAVPYCDFLMLRNASGQLQAVCRLMRLGRDNPVRSPLESGRFHLSPLLTALRYSREGVAEMGSPSFLSGCDSARAARLLWQGLILYMERNGLGFLVGWDALAKPAGIAQAFPRLMDAHGLHPDLEVETLSKFRRQSLPGPQDRFHADGDASEGGKLPPGLHEALRRGCRLAAEPVLNEAAGRWEFVWVSFRDMLETGEAGDWSR